MRLNPYSPDCYRNYLLRRLIVFFIIITGGLLIIYINLTCKKPVKQIPVKTEIKCYSPQSGEIFASVLKRAQISNELSNKIIRLFQTVNFNFKSIRPEDTLKLLYQNDSLIADNDQLIQKLAKLKSVQPIEQPRGLRLAVSGREAWLDVSVETLYEHQSNLEVRLAETRTQIAALTARLDNESYVNKAPAHLVEESRTQLEQKKTLQERLIKELEIIKL
jgi:valyl-tRNA synthetase